MKARIIFSILCIGLVVTSCIKDHQGHADDPFVPTADNYLYEGTLEQLFLNEKIATIDIRIKELEAVGPNDPNYNDAQAEIGTLSIDREDSEQQISLIPGLDQVYKVFPVPCDGFPNGKCVPVRLGHFVLSKFFKEAMVVVTDSKGTRASDNLVDMPGFENEWQYLEIPVFDDGNGILIKFLKTDIDGVESAYNLALSN
tara:strand:- start:2792 stop:3388 length:597 start_codon:yes stop_codon:yes gene_type:complete